MDRAESDDDEIHGESTSEENGCFNAPQPRAPTERNMLQFSEFSHLDGEDNMLTPRGRFQRCQSKPPPASTVVHSYHIQSFASGSSFASFPSTRQSGLIGSPSDMSSYRDYSVELAAKAEKIEKEPHASIEPVHGKHSKLSHMIRRNKERGISDGVDRSDLVATSQRFNPKTKRRIESNPESSLDDGSKGRSEEHGKVNVITSTKHLSGPPGILPHRAGSGKENDAPRKKNSGASDVTRSKLKSASRDTTSFPENRKKMSNSDLDRGIDDNNRRTSQGKKQNFNPDFSIPRHGSSSNSLVSVKTCELSSSEATAVEKRKRGTGNSETHTGHDPEKHTSLGRSSSRVSGPLAAVGPSTKAGSSHSNGVGHKQVIPKPSSLSGPSLGARLKGVLGHMPGQNDHPALAPLKGSGFTLPSRKVSGLLVLPKKKASPGC